MIKLSDVRVRPQYRTRVRYRLVVLEYAWEHGPTAAGRHYGLSARTIRRWRKRWRQGGGTELFVESVEPTLEDLPLEDFFRQVPEGRYRLTGSTPEGPAVRPGGVQLRHTGRP